MNKKINFGKRSIYAAGMAVALPFGLAACSDDSDDEETTEDTVEDDTDTDDTTEEETESVDVDETEDDDLGTDDSSDDADDTDNGTAPQLASRPSRKSLTVWP
ncbi:MAG: hypothetical protein QMB98_00560 [Flaviflexus sp.]|uniref:hypothetical protein n=1 Tax=Flaviflexus sp. TaxID=1969482 RepID=UPI00352D88E2